MDMNDVEWNTICRVCLQEGEMTSIHVKDDQNMTIKDKIIMCSSIEFQPNTSFPEQICSTCLEDLTVAYRFYSNCESTETVLKSITENLLSDQEEMFQEDEEYVESVKVKIEPDLYENTVSSESNEQEIEFLETYNYSESEGEIVTPDDQKLVEQNEFVEKSEPSNIPNPHDDNTSSIILKVDEDTETEEAVKEQEMFDELIKNNENVSVLTVRPVITNKRRLKQPLVPPEDQILSMTGENGETITFLGRSKPLKVCEICGNTYKYRHALESHMRRHRGEKPFQCPHCDKAFVIAFELKRHMRTHNGQKPYACKYCVRKFSDFGSRIKHERCHTGERPYICAQCGKSFAYSHVLSSHMLTHTGERRFHCEECGKRFTKSHHLKAHKNTHSRIPRDRSIAAAKATLKSKLIQQNQEFSVLDATNVPVGIVVETSASTSSHHPDTANLDDFANPQNILDYAFITVIDNATQLKAEHKTDDEHEEIGELIFQSETSSMELQ